MKAPLAWAALAATTPPAARVPPLLLRLASPNPSTSPASALTLQPKLSYLPNPSPLPSLSSFVFPLPSTPWGLSLLPALSSCYWPAELPFDPFPFSLDDTVVRLGGRACVDFCVVFIGEDGMSITKISASDWIAAEALGTHAKLCPRNGLWVRSLSLASTSWKPHARETGWTTYPRGAGTAKT